MRGNSTKRSHSKKESVVKVQNEAIDNVKLDVQQSQSEKLETLYKKHSQKKQISLYDQLKYKGQLLNIGAFFSLHNSKNQLPHIVKLTNIIQLLQSTETLPFIEVEWYLRKEELIIPQKYQKYYQHISKAQLFPSGKIIYVQIDAIDRQVTVISNKEYENLPFAYDNTFFTRVAYDPLSKSFVPEPSEWQSSCICQMPVNPQKNYIQCENCELWFHTDCVLKGKKLKEKDAYICDQCRQVQVATKNSKKNQESSVEKKSSKNIKSKEKLPKQKKKDDIKENMRSTRSKN